VYRRLGDAVHADQLRTDVAVAVQPGPWRFQVEGLAAENDPAQGQRRAGRDPSARMSWRKADCVWLRTVTPSARSRSNNCWGSG
jgi:hypothetical protein